MTNKDKFIKVVLKVLNPVRDRVEWVHFCYADKDLYNRYMSENNLYAEDLNSIISRWMMEDFRVDVSVTCTADIHIIRGVVKDFYKRSHPDVYLDSNVDRQGWLRVWITRKMKEDLKIYGEECK